MKLEHVEKIAEAVLYEGYMLYPYRQSSVKNQQRWNFGVLYPPTYCEGQIGSESSTMQTECLLRTTPATLVTVKIRFLQIVERAIGKLKNAGDETVEGLEANLELVDQLEVAGKIYRPWQEAVEREKIYCDIDLHSLARSRFEFFEFPSSKKFEFIYGGEGLTTGVIVRESEALAGSIQMCAEQLGDGMVKISVRVTNRKPFSRQSAAKMGDREAALSYSMISAHTILGVENGEFLSLLEFPPECADLVAACNNVGTWPVLVGENSDTILSSPIILYDHPQIAPESAGNLFDSTEIDEILSLRILTLTDDEKREMRESDDRTRAILERTEKMPEEQLMKLHGVLRGLQPVKGEA